jgi:hypothetical protein
MSQSDRTRHRPIPDRDLTAALRQPDQNGSSGSRAPSTPRDHRGDARPAPLPRVPAEHEGGTDNQVGDRTGPAAGYDIEPEQVRDKGGVQ